MKRDYLKHLGFTTQTICMSNEYIIDPKRLKIRPEIHRRMSFAYERGEHYYKAIGHALKGGNIFSCRATKKWLQARRIYIHYQNEFQNKQNLPLSK